ncbi:putative Uracil-DNA glycosylase superfamily [Candidatus Promineifilum breve]|uniref:Uracil-DNA glycosylase superfamily n=1 Tax=Candidatus Promineifilum breve TaxID=1806508 RepID=A0A160T2E9_9CHLR|nr:uracil-DNA glycosylase family protein [Candidatus Promineifilum breve]CUS03078.2 putative Uracil-DNA glycosylase superfamily [Candidatus Promineifilum breve]
MSSINELTTLQAEIRTCRRCLEEGYWIAPGPVLSGGPAARVMLIGQAPGITEAQVKRPFNAGSGRRLFQWLGQAGWDETDFRARAYMTAVTKCYPGRSNSGQGDRVATPFEQALCRPWLEQELKLIEPRLLILVGGLAIKLLYPPAARLNEIIGTAAYFPLEALNDPLNFDLSQATIVTSEQGVLTGHSPAGRYIVPLPHPSGASLWPNKPENKGLIDQALGLLAHIRTVNEL